MGSAEKRAPSQACLTIYCTHAYIKHRWALYKDYNIMKHLSKTEIDELFNLDKVLININKIYKRIGLK